MKVNRRMVFIFVILSMLLAMSCNLLDLLQAPTSDDPTESAEVNEELSVDEEEAPLPPTPMPSATFEPSPEPLPAAWVVLATDTELLYQREGETTLQTASPGGYIVSISPAPIGGKVAVIRSANEGGSGELWLDLFDLLNGEWIPVTPLTNADTVLGNWDDSMGMEARDANIATTYSLPVWKPDGSAVVFISAHEGQFAQPFTYHVDTGELHDVSLGGASHWFSPAISPDGQFIVVPSAFQFGTGAGYSMDSLAAARVDGGEVPILLDVSHSIDLQTWGWLDRNTAVISDVSIMAGPINLRTLDIFTEEQQVIMEDFFTEAAVSSDQGTVMFTSTMGELLDYIEPQQIAESGLYHWDRSTQTLQKVNDLAEYPSRVSWDRNAQCYYADLPRVLNETEDEIWAYTASGGMSNDCVAINPAAQDLPQVSPSGDYYAFANLVFQSPEMNAFYVQGFSEPNATKLADGSVYTFSWHPVKDILLFFQSGKVFTAAAPDFLVQQVMAAPESLLALYWVNP